jgi:hypothetical protein
MLIEDKVSPFIFIISALALSQNPHNEEGTAMTLQVKALSLKMAKIMASERVITIFIRKFSASLYFR